MAFYRGQKVTMKLSWLWIPQIPLLGDDGKHPKFGDVLTITSIGREPFAFEWLTFAEHGDNGYRASIFCPVVEPKLPACLTELQDIKNHKPIKEPAIGPEAFA